MFQNIKVDIIYYKTPTDFEMEFNLSGCCRMRLLTDKATDRKILVNQLVRAVTRSRIIMIAGTLFGEEGIIETCAKAIGKPLTKLNNSQFGIPDEQHIEIIAESIPLVSTDGIFGGCIIEQGPQTLILLSENKDIRKNIMQNLIHSYVKEVCEGETDDMQDPSTLQEEMQEELSVSEDIPAEEETLEEVAENTIEEEASEDTDEEAQDVFNEETQIPEDKEEKEETESDISDGDFQDLNEPQNPPVIVPSPKEDEILSDDLVVDTPSFRFRRKNKDDFDIKEFENESETYIVNDDYYNKKSIFSGLNIPIIILIILLLVVLAMLVYSMFIVPSMEGVPVGEYLKETYTTLFG